MDWSAILLSLRLASIVAVVLLVIALPLAYWLTFSSRRWTFVVEASVALPIVLPPTVLGFYVLLALGSRSPIGRAWSVWTGHSLALHSRRWSLPPFFTPCRLPCNRSPRRSHRSIGRSWKAAATLGVGRLRTFTRVVVRLSVDGIVAAVVLTFAHTIGEFGVVLMVCGNLPGITRTASIAIYDEVQALNLTAAHETALVLLAISLAALLAVYALIRKPWAVAPVS